MQYIGGVHIKKSSQISIVNRTFLKKGPSGKSFTYIYKHVNVNTACLDFYNHIVYHLPFEINE